MTLKTICEELGINVIQFCKITGYTRQALHSLDTSNLKVAKMRWNAAIVSLENFAEFRKEKEINQAIEKFERAKKQIEKLKP